MEMDELYWFLEYKPRTETRENIYIMTMVSREPRQIIGHVVSRDKTSKTISSIFTTKMTPSPWRVSMLICAIISLLWHAAAGVFRESWKIFKMS